MNLERFRNSPAGRLVKTGQDEAAYWAFIPNPLPPALTLDIELVCALSDADRALGELSGLGRTMANPDLLIRPFIRREAVLSSRIEGTQADIADLYAYEAGQLSGVRHAVPESDVREVLNYVHATEHGLERIKTLPISLRLMRELHERLMEGVRGKPATPGEFRKSQNWIGRPGCTLNDASFVPPPVPEMHAALDAFEKYLHSDDAYPPLVRLALIHHQFEAIHPFVDGNGRIGRLLISLLLVHWNLLPAPLLYLSAYFEKNRQAYYDGLLAVSERGAWREWVLFFLRGVAEQAVDANTRAKRLQDLQIGWRKQLQKVRAGGWVLGVADALFEDPYVSAGHIVERYQISHQAAMKILRRLESMKILRQTSEQKRNRLYFAPEIVGGGE